MTPRDIAPSVNDPVDFFVTHFQRPSSRDFRLLKVVKSVFYNGDDRCIELHWGIGK